MSTGGVELIAVGGQRLRLGSWRGSTCTGYLAPSGDGVAVTPETLRAALDHLARAGYDSAFTGAVPAPEAGPFLRAGFVVRERLHLLSHALDDVARPPRGSSRRARRSDRPAVLDLDHRAFQPFWRLDDSALEESLRATPVARFRVSTWPGSPTGPGRVGQDTARAKEGDRAALTGYAIVGAGGERGYVQRLAVHPLHRGRGLAEALLADGLRWLVRRGARSALVNTQEGNQRALRLYQRVGFVPEPHGLVVLAAATRS